ASRGEKFFVESCSRCHGTYGSGGSYPEKTVPIDEVDTDRARFEAIAPEWRREYGKSWFGHYGEKPLHAKPAGYVAPPLDGIWASAPYLHNGAVPTLWHVLHPAARPAIWKRTEDGYDRERVGLEVATYDRYPDGVRSAAARRRIFDTRLFGKSAAGHSFPDELSEAEKRAVLEYLKTL